jgi:hypothetical protein
MQQLSVNGIKIELTDIDDDGSLAQTIQSLNQQDQQPQ